MAMVKKLVEKMEIQTLKILRGEFLTWEPTVLRTSTHHPHAHAFGRRVPFFVPPSRPTCSGCRRRAYSKPSQKANKQEIQNDHMKRKFSDLIRQFGDPHQSNPVRSIPVHVMSVRPSPSHASPVQSRPVQSSPVKSSPDQSSSVLSIPFQLSPA